MRLLRAAALLVSIVVACLFAAYLVACVLTVLPSPQASIITAMILFGVASMICLTLAVAEPWVRHAKPLLAEAPA